MMKRIFLMAALSAAAATMSARMPQASDVVIRDIKAAHTGSNLDLSFILDFQKMPTGTNIETRLTPVVKSASDSVVLPSITLAGRNRLIQAERLGIIDNPGNTYYKSGKIAELPYEAAPAWEPWMENATIDLILENVGCCQSRRTIADRGLARLDMGERRFDVPMEYITPVEERVKMRNAKGEAYIDFVVNKTDIRPDYRNNPVELAKIRATIDSIKSDPDTKITKLTITGYASPEGSYANNERLAKGRTEALAEYVRRLFTFPKDLMKTSWVAEDWAGLRTRVENSNLPHKKEILEIIDSNLAPDAKDQKLRTSFPSDYQYMLTNFYPALRHSDYTVEYEVRKYTDPAEIAKVFRKNPNKLSLRELFIYAETLNPSSQEYADVFETAARMYPKDQTANLNAANSAIMHGEFKAAEVYLGKAGDTPQANYARGVLAAKEGDYAKAAGFFAKAKAGGINTSTAEAALKRMTEPEVVILSHD